MVLTENNALVPHLLLIRTPVLVLVHFVIALHCISILQIPRVHQPFRESFVPRNQGCQFHRQ